MASRPFRARAWHTVSGLVAATALMGLPASGDQLVLPCSTYTTLLKPDPLPDASYGGAVELHVDQAPYDTGVLMRFELSSIAPGTQVTGVQLVVDLFNGGSSHSAFELLRDFDEGTATWLEASAGSPWTAPGATGVTDQGAQVLFTFGGARTTVWNAAGVGVTQRWVNQPGTNHGFHISGAVATGTDQVGFSSSEASSISMRPALAVTLDGGGTIVFQAGDGGSAGVRDTTIIGTPPADTPLPGRPVIIADEPRVMGIHAVALIRCEVPADLQVVAGTVSVRLANTSTPAAGVDLRECLVPWDPATANWSRSNASTSWSAPGAAGTGDRGPVVGSTGAAAGVLTVPLTDAGLAMVDRWGRGANTGFFLVATGQTGQYVAAGAPSLILEVRDGGAFDAGAGANDAGVVDAGPASSDGGANPDGGSSGASPRALQIGCSTSPAPPLITTLAVGLWWRRRRAVTASTSPEEAQAGAEAHPIRPRGDTRPS